MSRRRRSSAAEPLAESPAGDRLRPVWLGVLAALFVATPILPSETVLFGGSAFVLMLLWWLLLAAWAVSGVARGRLTFQGGPATWAWLGLLAWHSTSALVMAWQGHPRASWNMLWQWMSFGIAFFLARQLLVTAAERRAIIAIMIGLAVSVSVVGYLQCFYEFPATQEAYRQDPDKVLREAGVHAPAGTSQRRVFEDRLNGTEPMATFALTNSLAGFLAPWLIVVLGILMTNWTTSGTSRWLRIAGIVAAVLIMGCLVLTKSRTAWLATFTGIGLLIVYGRRAGWRPDWKLVAGIGAAAAVLPLLAVIVGGLDWLVVLESSKSVMYRVQYWRATADLIGDYPWFGCGPGNFQQYYTAYKLPEASETIAEPHNFLLEVWATAGTPALALLVAVFGGMAGQVWLAERRSTARRGNGPSKPDSVSDESKRGSLGAVVWGAAIGGLVAFVACGYLESYFPSPGLLYLGFPVAAGLCIGLWNWVRKGHLSSAVLAVALVVMLVNFLAAGGFSFAGVVQSLWLLGALLLNHVEAPSGSTAEARTGTLQRNGALVVVMVVCALLACFHQTTFSPVTESQNWLMEGSTRRGLGQPLPALAAYSRAAEADPYSPEPWEQACELSNEIWLQTDDPTFQQKFRAAARETVNRNRRSSVAHSVIGHRWLAAYRRFSKRDFLDQAVASYGIAVKLYPNYNLGRAQYAWALHLAGDRAAAGTQAAEALRLDELNPHQEQQLEQQRLFDLPSADASQPAAPGDRSAEQSLRDLRNP